MKKLKIITLTTITIGVLAAVCLVAVFWTKPQSIREYLGKQAYPSQYFSLITNDELAKVLVDSFDKPSPKNQSTAKKLLAKYLETNEQVEEAYKIAQHDYETIRTTEKRIQKLHKSQEFSDLTFFVTRYGKPSSPSKKQVIAAIEKLMTQYPDELLSQISLIRFCIYETQEQICDELEHVEQSEANGTVLTGIADYHWQKGEQQKAANTLDKALKQNNISNYPITAAYLEQLDKSLRDPAHPRTYSHILSYWSYYSAFPTPFGMYGKTLMDMCVNKENFSKWVRLCQQSVENLATNHEFFMSTGYGQRLISQLPESERAAFEHKTNDWQKKREQIRNIKPPFDTTFEITALYESNVEKNSKSPADNYLNSNLTFPINTAVPDKLWQQYLSDISNVGDARAIENLDKRLFAHKQM